MIMKLKHSWIISSQHGKKPPAWLVGWAGYGLEQDTRHESLRQRCRTAVEVAQAYWMWQRQASLDRISSVSTFQFVFALREELPPHWRHPQLWIPRPMKP